MSELEVREEPAGGAVVAKQPKARPGFAIALAVVTCALMVVPPTVLGTAMFAVVSLCYLWMIATDIPPVLEQTTQMRPEVLALASVGVSLFYFELIVDHAVLPLSLDALADPFMALAMGCVGLFGAAIPAYAVRLWRFWQREML